MSPFLCTNISLSFKNLCIITNLFYWLGCIVLCCIDNNLLYTHSIWHIESVPRSAILMGWRDLSDTASGESGGRHVRQPRALLVAVGFNTMDFMFTTTIYYFNCDDVIWQ